MNGFQHEGHPDAEHRPRDGSALQGHSAGEQPLHAIMERHGLSNRDLVAVSIEHLTHKQVQKGRKGRPVTRNIQQKILNALHEALGEEKYGLPDLFSYRGR